MTYRPKPFDLGEPTPSDFRDEAIKSVEFAERRTVDGPMPAVKETYNCQAHGIVNLIYIPNYAGIMDRFKDIPEVDHTIVSACMDCAKKKQAEMFDAHKKEVKRVAAEKEEAEILERIEGYGVSLRNIKYDIRDIDARNDEQKSAIDKLRLICKAIEDRKDAGNLILSGSVGTGKTLLASSAVVALVRAGYYAKIRTVSHIIRKLKGAWRRDCDYSEEDVIKDLVNLDLLVIDEVGVQFGSDTEKMFIFEIIDGRYNKMKPTVIISNLAVSGIKELIGERCIDRLREDGGKVVAFDYASQRGKKQS